MLNSKIVVTGGAGFIGSRFIKHLNDVGITDIIVVDDLSDGHKFKNLKGLEFSHYIDKDAFLNFLERSTYYVDIEQDEALFADVLISDITTIVHLGAISDTTRWDGKEVMKQNYEYSVKLLDHLISLDVEAKFIYASSASVYGNKRDGSADPLNLYAFSKYMFDKYVLNKLVENYKEQINNGENDPSKHLPQIVGLRFFNVYGSPNEWHKKNQASPIYKFYHQMKDFGSIAVFDRDAERDFVHVDDVCSVISFFLNNYSTGIFDVGTGKTASFEEIAQMHQIEMDGTIVKIPFPVELNGHYQFYTRANLDALLSVGYVKPFITLEEGINKFTKEMKEYDTLYRS